MIWAIPAALASGTTTEDRVELFADAGVFTGQFGLSFGLGGGWRDRGVLLQGVAGVGGRADLLDTGASDRPGFGLGTAALTLDTPSSGHTRTGVTVLVDTALLDGDEKDCTGVSACRNGLFVRLGSPEGLALGFQPAAAIRFAGVGASGTTFAAGIGFQPHWRYGNFLPAPRLDLMVALGPDWSVHTWAGRYGGSFGVGRTLSRPRHG